MTRSGVVTPREALAAGSSYLVVGRPGYQAGGSQGRRCSICGNDSLQSTFTRAFFPVNFLEYSIHVSGEHHSAPG